MIIKATTVKIVAATATNVVGSCERSPPWFPSSPSLTVLLLLPLPLPPEVVFVDDSVIVALF